jgi:membrane protease YdiL (CAAX protease family)
MSEGRTVSADSPGASSDLKQDSVGDPLLRVLLGFLIIWLVLDRLAATLGSVRGEAGLAICAAVVLTAVIVERILFGAGPSVSLRSLGFRWPGRQAIIATLILGAALLAFYPIFSLTMSAPPGLIHGWPLLAVGLFAQGGIAEETLFRGYLFRHIRQGRSFWRAAVIASLPFVAVHLLLFASLDVPLALAALLLSVSLSFPLAWLFDLSGGSVWPPAILHFLVQGSIKLVVVPEADGSTLALGWIAWACLLPWLVFLVRPRQAAQPA